MVEVGIPVVVGNEACDAGGRFFANGQRKSKRGLSLTRLQESFVAQALSGTYDTDQPEPRKALPAYESQLGDDRHAYSCVTFVARMVDSDSISEPREL